MLNRSRHERIQAMMQHEGGGFGRSFDGRDKMFGTSRGKDRFFKKGNLQYIILKLLLDEPKHGYQIIKDLESQFKGFYSPSPGSVYPILQMLEDRDFVSIIKEGNKKVYTVTEEGRQFLADNIDNDDFSKRMEHFKNMDMDKLKKSRNDIQELFKLFMIAGQSAMKDEEKYKAFQELIKETRSKLESFQEEN
ncbi:PadR family transcriptional regulator [Mammaliicoccus stepanovicii]|uniref:PadR family transcriptional regulator n=1 Tax=Mammaliicoccus stepanovicii TaxID=643214 RepID=A0A239ZSW8_9STAP|nr:PadR family transcriptional regulator [Mammaliicoccus stepanovicii]PNZ77098.1 PadR family transcriptional regulator [Mammaliicoccus stepanovicii]GGI38801.1 hypothetical protein GCM10010896_00200 [Mammaliicoccus stepanovicii]SNV73873.1 PadR family transcriptional regulator [Mammaliicoccus stepanovicii]